jgi:uncharacterized peroxidase-related enzyme
MPYVTEVDEQQAAPSLRDLYSKIEQGLGFIPHFYKALGAMPEAIDAQLNLNSAIMNDAALPKVVKEQIGVVVSGINASSYCIAIHLELLRRFGVEKPIGRKLATDYENAPVEEKVKVLFRFADKLTRRPMDIEDEDIEAVQRAGWSEAALRETALTVAYFNYVNRVALGLGLVADF